MTVVTNIARKTPKTLNTRKTRSTSKTLRLTAYLAALLCLAIPAHAEWVRRVTDGIMGTRITVELWADDAAKGDRAIDALLDEMRHIDDSMSTYKPTSEVSEVNAKAADGPMHISKELFDLLTTAKEYSVITDGAFDITYASVGYMYDFRKHVHPDEAQIDKALPAVNFRHVLLDPKNQTVQFSQKGVRIDLGGIAKGYSVDRGIDVLKSFGITRAYVSAGGDSRIIGDRFGKPWVVGIRDPRKGEGQVIARLPLVDAAISTSGDYERFFEENGVRYHHIIDPHTGHSASKVRSATVIGPYATRTDGLSKTAFVLGPEKAMEIYNRIFEGNAARPRSLAGEVDCGRWRKAERVLPPRSRPHTVRLRASGRGCRVRRDLHRLRGSIHGLEQHRAPPDALHVLQHLARPLGIEAAPIELIVMPEHQGAVAAHLADGHVRRAKIVFIVQQTLLQRLDVPGNHLELAILLPLVTKQPHVRRNAGRQMIA
jgi:thiamine biosynthesis lipoprotein